MLAALGALPSAAPFGEDGKQLFRILAAGFSVKADLGPIWGRFWGGKRSRFESGILSKICNSDVKLMKTYENVTSPNPHFCEEKS